MNSGGSSTTSSEVPAEWKPYYNQVVQNALGTMQQLPLFQGGSGQVGGMPGGYGMPGGMPVGGGTANPLAGMTAEQIQAWIASGGVPPPAAGGEPAAGGGTDTAPVPPPTPETIPGQGDFIPDRQRTAWDPSQGAMTYQPAEVAGASGLQQKGAETAATIGTRPGEADTAAGYAAKGGEKSRESAEAAGAVYKGQQEPGDYAASRTALGEAGKAVSLDNPMSNSLIQEALGIFDNSMRDTLMNQTALAGHSIGGSGSNIALTKAKANYLMPTMFKAMDVTSADRDRQLGVASGYGQIGSAETARRYGAADRLAGLGRDADAREFGASNAFRGLAGDETNRRIAGTNAEMQVGGIGRGIAQEGANAEQAERMRLTDVAKQIGLGPLTSMLPAMMGSSTTTQGGKMS